jgi:Rrf2 family cysteine metabolism transcriptional repressor
MKVSTRVHYGLRAMTELARSYRDERPLSISEIARNEDLPLSYLEQLVGELRRAGLVEGTRGVRGGYRLARQPSAITVGDIYRVLEGEVAPVDCTAEDYAPGSCTRESVCLSRSIWSRVQAAILGVLDTTTLDDLLISEVLQQHVMAGPQFVPLEGVPAYLDATDGADGAEPFEAATQAHTPTHPHKGEFAHA